MSFDKKELAAVITENFDRSIFEGKIEFSDKYPELLGFSIEPIPGISRGILGMRLSFGTDGHLVLYSSGYDRAAMISTFTRFVWGLFK